MPVTLAGTMPDRVTHTDLRYDGGAPWLDFLTTQGYPLSDAPAERIPTPARLEEFLTEVGLRPEREIGEDDLAAARVLRDALRAVALAVLDGRGPDHAALAVVAGWAERASGRLALEVRPRLVRRPPPTAAEALGRLARAALEDLTGPRMTEIHACAEPICRKLYLDPSGRKKWCSTSTCGNRARVRAHRAATRA
jgi:predicted RNA-binding Zn ribbon-like protein